MLTDFEGFIDSHGLCTFQPSQSARSRSNRSPEPVRGIPIWAVLEAEAARQILRELQSGSRVRALRLLEELSFSLGTRWE